MPASPTQAQRDAARANGRRSHGPVTAEGKARSAMNARSFGLRCAEISLIEGEDPKLFAMLQASVHDQFRPSSPLEAALCTRMVAALWRSSRAERLESSFWDLYPKSLPLDAANPMPQILGHDHDLQRYSLATALRYITESDNAFARALRNLTQLRSGKADPLSGEVYLASDAARLHRNAEPDQEEAGHRPLPVDANLPAASPAANDDIAAILPSDMPPAPPLPVVPDPPAPPIPTNEPKQPPSMTADPSVAALHVPRTTLEKLPAHQASYALPPSLSPPASPCEGALPPSLPCQTASPSEIALCELARMRTTLRETCPPALLAEAETFILSHGEDGMGPPPWVQDLPRAGAA